LEDWELSYVWSVFVLGLYPLARWLFDAHGHFAEGHKTQYTYGCLLHSKSAILGGGKACHSFRRDASANRDVSQAIIDRYQWSSTQAWQSISSSTYPRVLFAHGGDFGPKDGGDGEAI